jgi:hypothetical protein
MPVTLNEMNSLSFIEPRNSKDGTVPRFSNPPAVEPSYKDYTMIDDIFSCQTTLPAGTQLDTSMASYNSNSIIPSYHHAVCPSSAQQGLQNLVQHSNQLPRNNMYVPPQYVYGNFNSATQAVNSTIPQYQTTFQYPPFAGSVPNLQNAIYTDTSIPIGAQYFPQTQPAIYGQVQPAPSFVEGFAFDQNKSTKSISTCAECNTKNHWLGIILLIIIVLLLLGYIYHLRAKSKNGARMF